MIFAWSGVVDVLGPVPRFLIAFFAGTSATSIVLLIVAKLLVHFICGRGHKLVVGSSPLKPKRRPRRANRTPRSPSKTPRSPSKVNFEELAPAVGYASSFQSILKLDRECCVPQSPWQAVGFGQTVTAMPVLAWYSPSEERHADELRAQLPASAREQLLSEPADIRDTLFLVRFLRGCRTVPLASKACKRLLQFRKENADLISRARERIPPDATTFDFHRTLGEVLVPFEMEWIEDGTREGLPAALFELRHVTTASWLAWRSTAITEWMVSVMEQYSIVLHNLGLQHHTMCKLVNLVDCSSSSLSAWMTANPIKTMGRMRKILPIVSLYPEFVHRLVLFNTSLSLTPHLKLFKGAGGEWFSSWFEDNATTLAKNDKTKLFLCNAGDWSKLCRWLTPHCIYEWACTIPASDDYEVEGGCAAAIVIELGSRQDAAWSCAPIYRRSRLKFQLLFFGVDESIIPKWVAEGPGEGKFKAPSDGVLLLVADNTSSYVNAGLARWSLKLLPS